MKFDTSRQWSLILTCFSLWVSRFLDPALLEGIGYAGIFTVGILHGSNDLHLLRKLSPGNGFRIGLLRHLAYVGVAVGVLGLFLLKPSWVLYFFIGISAYHFGEQHFERVGGRRGWRIPLNLTYGLLIFSLLFYARSADVLPIIHEVTGHVLQSAHFAASAVVSAGLFAVCYAGFSWGRKGGGVGIWVDVLVLGLLFLLFRESPLVWGFSVYFVLWHSLPSLRQQAGWLHGETGWTGIRAYFATAWPYWALALIGLAVMWYVGSRYAEQLLTILVYFLACITFPHVVVMSVLQRKFGEVPSAELPDENC